MQIISTISDMKLAGISGTKKREHLKGKITVINFKQTVRTRILETYIEM